jgi:putative SOS response-associated peptidase YedK
VGEIRNPMAVILTSEDHGLWLDPDEREANPLLPLLAHYPDDLMEAYPVSRFVNRPTNDDPHGIQSLPGR